MQFEVLKKREVNSMNNSYYNYLKEEISIKDVCGQLGMQIIKKGKENATLCPFHNDTNPSLMLYKDHYHCFACNAHGDIFTIIKKIKKNDFYESVNWLENEFPYVISRKPEIASQKKYSKKIGFDIAYDSFKKMSIEEKRLLEKFSEKRKYSNEFLIDCEIFYVQKNKLSKQYINDIEYRNLLLEKYLIKEELTVDADNQQMYYMDTFKQDRIVITLRDYNNVIIGFVGRANQDEKPKYLFTKHLPKGNFLYRLNEVKNRRLRKINEDKKLDLYIVEGAFDALRLECLGLDAVAVLGSHITQAQVLVLEIFLNDIAKDYNSINIHIFLDSDDAGMNGTLKSIRNLWLNETTRKIYISVVTNKDIFKDRKEDSKISDFKDPDQILISNNEINQKEWISNNEIKVFEFLMRYLYNSENLVFDEDSFEIFYKEKLDVDQRINLLGKVIGIISDKHWLEIVERYSAIELECFELEMCKLYLGFGQKNVGINPNVKIKSYRSTFQIAIEIAKNSYIKEDVPIDEFTWNRISCCADVFYDYFYNILKSKNHLKIPMLSIKIPKKFDEYRLKTLYSHEQLIMQQYVLNELLREDTYRKYELCIPAVRYNPNRFCEVYTTGLDYYDFYNNSDNSAVSFAYQINMPAVNGDFRANEGMFRPFYDCWKSFILFIRNGIDKINSDTIYKVKLDIRKFYENITNYSVRNTLLPMLKEALGAVENRFQCMSGNSEDIDSKEEDAKYIVEWIIDELFNYKYYSAKDGKEESSDSALIGIPQGPNLSAYIANIVLFKLDKAVAEYVDGINKDYKKENDEGIAVRYARYVDDMVIVSENPIYLNEIKNIIKNELSKLELELSPKTDDAEKITKEDAYEWLVSEKGGLGISSVFDFAEEPIESIIEEYEDYEVLNRRNALKLLHNITIDFNYIDDSERNNMISSFFKTQDVRYTDIVRFAEMLIRHIIRSNTNSSSDILNLYEQEWMQGCLDSSSDSMFRREGIMFLSFLQGCINILKAKENGSMSVEEVEQRKRDKLSINHMVLNKNLVQICENYTLDSEILQENQEVLKIKLLQFMNLVFENSSQKNINQIEKTFIDNLNIKNEYIARWIYFTYYNTNSDTHFQLKENYKKENKTLYYFHYCISNMMRVKKMIDYNTIKSSILHFERELKCSDDRFAKCMLIWFYDNIEYCKSDTEIALSILVNIATPKILSEIIDNNDILKNCLFVQEENEKCMKYLPVPPGVEYPGIFAIAEAINNKKVKRADFSKNAESIGNFIWQVQPKNNCQYDIQTAELNGEWEGLNEYLIKVKNTNEYVLKIAEIYEQLYKYIKINENHNKLILSKYHIYVNESGIIALTYKIEDKILNSSVAISQGSNSLIVKQVAESGSEYWQAGYILRDALEIDKIIILNNNTDEDLVNQMLYYSFDRLTGETINKNYVNKSNKSYKKSVNRTLNSLKKFNEEKSNKKIFILDCIMINNFISHRIKQNSYDYANGEVEYQLATWAKNYLNRNYNIIEEIFVQECDEIVYKDDISIRRAALAYLNIGEKISMVSKKYINMDGIRLLAGGIFSNSALINLRMQVLERIHLLEENERLNFKNREYPLELLGIDEDKITLLTNCKNQIKDLKDVSDNLLDRKYDSRIKNITHMGWLLLLCWLLEMDDLPNYIITDRKKRTINESLKKEILYLKNFFLLNDEITSKDNCQKEFPFDGIENFIKLWTKENIEKMFMIFSEIDKVDEIKIETISSEFFKFNTSKNSVSIELEGKKLNQQPKQFFTYGKLGVANISQEKDIENKNNVIWTQTIKNDKILGISAIEDMLSNIAIYNDSKNKPKVEKKLNNVIEISEKRGTSFEIEEKENEKNKYRYEDLIIKEDLLADNESRNDSIDETTNADIENFCREKTPFDVKKFYNKIYKVQEYQNSNWKSREKGFENIDRIALFQFEVDDSYQHPEVEVCKQVNDEGRRKKNSCAEFRRQKLLKNVMDACSNFSVEILLLPEYSIRPETVKWIYDYINEQNYTFSVWAGTFRIVPNYILDKTVFEEDLSKEDCYWSAVLPVINNKANAYCKGKIENDFKSMQVITSRFKKYPAISLQELINPKPAKENMFKATIKYKFGKVIFGDARDDVTELICAEMFMMTSPSNMNSFLRASYELYNRLNGSTISLLDYKETVNNDVRDFGESTAIYQQENKYGRTPIILVPAYTTRATDYYVTGQAGYLASGLTTVFCNAVGEGAIGGSCFIGTDSWDDFRQSKNKYMPDFSPYHGITPGIYQQFLEHKDRGGLGKNEQALLICDINPNISFKGRPNPESLGKSLELVAHLPIIEFSIPIRSQDEKNKPYNDKKCRCQKVKERKIFYSECLDCKKSNKCFRCDDVMKSIVKICNHIIDCKKDKDFKTTIQDKDYEFIRDAFKTLGESIGSDWLKRRGDKYKEQHINNPQKWPAPTLIDWIFVELDYNEYEERPTEIDVPKF